MQSRLRSLDAGKLPLSPEVQQQLLRHPAPPPATGAAPAEDHLPLLQEIFASGVSGSNGSQGVGGFQPGLGRWGLYHAWRRNPPFPPNQDGGRDHRVCFWCEAPGPPLAALVLARQGQDFPDPERFLPELPGLPALASLPPEPWIQQLLQQCTVAVADGQQAQLQGLLRSGLAQWLMVQPDRLQVPASDPEQLLPASAPMLWVGNRWHMLWEGELPPDPEQLQQLLAGCLNRAAEWGALWSGR